MLEARYMIPNLEIMEKKIRPALVSAGAVCRGWYGLTDVIFGPEEDYNNGFVRLRITRNTRIPSLSVVLTDKNTEWGVYGKTDILVERKGFGDIAAEKYVEHAYKPLKKVFAFSRDGMEYALGDLRIFTEDILVPGIRWSVEIEGPGVRALIACAELLGLGEPIGDSVPTLVQHFTRR